MTSPKHFGTDGIRGVANLGLLAPEDLLRVGRALGRLARRDRDPASVVLARDPRRSSSMISCALSAGMASEGAGVIDLGPLPTPGLAALIEESGGALGVMVSASHNPMRDNGVKVLAPDGAKIADSDELWLEAEMENAPMTPPTGVDVGVVRRGTDAVSRYVEHLRRAFPTLRLDGVTIVVDGANGATAEAGPRMFTELGATVIPLFHEPDGVNINDGCGAVHPEAMAAAVARHGADVGVAFDGDGDRLIMAGHDGSVLDGDRILYLCAAHLKARGELPGDTVVGTVMTNFGFELALRDLGVTLERTPVGDRHVAARLREGGFALGGEPSGHLIFGDANRYIGDGLFSALYALSVAREAGRPLLELVSPMRPVPQVLVNVEVAARPPLDSLTRTPDAMRDAETELAGEGRVLVRYSGTENLLRVMVEGREQASVERLAGAIADVARDEIGTPDRAAS